MSTLSKEAQTLHYIALKHGSSEQTVNAERAIRYQHLREIITTTSEIESLARGVFASFSIQDETPNTG